MRGLRRQQSGPLPSVLHNNLIKAKGSHQSLAIAIVGNKMFAQASENAARLRRDIVGITRSDALDQLIPHRLGHR